MTSASARPMFPHTIDSTILSAFRSCPQKAFRQYVQHWKSRFPSVHLIAGGAFASGIEAARRAFFIGGRSAEDAEGIGLAALIAHYGDFPCPPDSPKSLERMCGALEYYFSMYPLGADGAEPVTFANGHKGIEFSFAEPLDIAHPITGDPILYTGRSDQIAERMDGIFIYDEKTTSSLGATFARQWEMRSQFTGYQWAAARHGIQAKGSIVRGVSILKTKYDTMEVPTYRSKYEIERWEQQVLRDVKRMIQCWKEGYWDFSLDAGCVEYGGCPFVAVCKSSQPDDWLPVNFEQRVWDPLARRELSVKEYEESWGHARGVNEAPAPELPGGVSPEQAASLSKELSGMLGG
jgi:hypothetical protein